MATGVHPDTVARGARELEGALESAGVEPVGRVRAPGGGRKPATETDPGLAPALTALVDPETRGDPESPLVWTTKSTRNLADALTASGHRVSDRTVLGPGGQRHAHRPARRGHADPVAESGEITVHAPIAPCRVLGGQAHDQGADTSRDGGSARSGVRGGPAAADQLSVPAQDC